MNHGIYPASLAMSPVTLAPKWPTSEDVKGQRLLAAPLLSSQLITMLELSYLHF